MSLEILYNYELSHIKKKQDAVVCFVHSWLITKGFKCIGKGEEIPKDNIRQSDMLPPGWSADDIYSLIYQRQTTGDTYLLEIVNFDSTLLHFMRIKDMKVSSTEVNPSDYVTNNLSSFDGAFHKQSLDSFSKRLTGELLGLFEEKPKAVPHEKVRSPDRHHPDPCRVPYARPEWEQPTNPWSIGRSDLDPLDGGMGSGMIFDPMRTGFPSYGGPGRGTGGPNILPRDERPPQSSSPSSSAGAITAANNPSSRRWMPVNELQATSFSNQSERNDGIFRKVRGNMNEGAPKTIQQVREEVAKESGVFIPRQQLYLHDEMNRGLSHTFKKLSSVAQFEQKEKELFQLLAYRDKDLAAATSQIADLTAKLNLREFQLRESTHRNSALLRQLSRWQYNYSELSRELEYIKNEREQEDTELKVVDNLPSSDGSFTSVASCMDGSGREGQLECTVNTFDGNNTLGEGIVEAFSQQQENIIDILVYDTLPSGTMEGCGGMGGPGHRGRGRGRVRLL